MMRLLISLLLALILGACAAEDPDPCDPDCPPTNCGETDQECG